MPEHSDWEVVFRFYAGLHLLSAYFSTKNPRFQAARHEERIQAIKRSPELVKVSGFLLAYRFLQEVSEQVRYDPGFRITDDHVTRAKQNLALLERVLDSKVARALGGPN
jgi:hypothetical protein